MGPSLHGHEAADELVRRLNQLVADQLKVLLETKHIYQRLSIDPDLIITDLRNRIFAEPPQHHESFDLAVARLIETARFGPAGREMFLSEGGGANKRVPTLTIGNIKIFCTRCGEPEAFAPVYYRDVTKEIQTDWPQVAPLPTALQLFSLAYQCQRCKYALVGFLVRRQRWHLILDGRSPMEHIALPKYIPKTEETFFRDAIIAIHGGKTLAALFYLRTFIEQFARRQTGMTGRATGDEIMAAYSEALPPAQRDQMPSLKEWYEKLSVALHSATEDAELFEEAKEKIEQHFDIRRVFKIREKS